MFATGQLLIEIITIGSIASIWLFLILAKLPIFTKSLIELEQHTQFVPLIIVISIAIIYQFGWFMHWVGWRLAIKFLEPHRNKIFQQLKVNYDDIRPHIYQSASDSQLSELRHEVGRMRMCRSNTINFLLIAIVLFFYGKSVFIVAIICLLFSFALAAQTWHVHRQHYEKMYQIYNAICLKPQIMEKEPQIKGN